MYKDNNIQEYNNYEGNTQNSILYEKCRNQKSTSGPASMPQLLSFHLWTKKSLVPIPGQGTSWGCVFDPQQGTCARDSQLMLIFLSLSTFLPFSLKFNKIFF